MHESVHHVEKKRNLFSLFIKYGKTPTLDRKRILHSTLQYHTENFVHANNDLRLCT